jgi:hypothetical protein
VKIFLVILSSSILSKWPSQLILCPFIYFTIFSPLFISSSSRFVLIFHFPIFIFRTIYSSKYFPFKNKQTLFFFLCNRPCFRSICYYRSYYCLI